MNVSGVSGPQFTRDDTMREANASCHYFCVCKRHLRAWKKHAAGNVRLLCLPIAGHWVFGYCRNRFRSETGVRAAFAKAVPNAMTKSVAKLCGEIAQDHADALAGKLSGGKE